MRSKFSMILAGLALVVITGVQIYLIVGLYNLRKEAFDEKYSQGIGDGMIELQNRYHTNGLDSAFYLIDFEAYKLLDKYQEMLTDSMKVALNSYALSRIYSLLLENEKITPFLQAYFRVNNLDDDFKSGIFIRALTLLDQNKLIPVIDDKNPAVKEIINSALKKGAFLVNTFNAEGDNFRIQIEYYIDFTHKSRIILREMTGAMILALFSIFVTGAIFFLTIRNMLKHRELSLMKTDFINNMAHELKTPLTTISVAGGTLAEPEIQKDPERIIDLVSLIRQQNQHLSRLIDHILDINLWERDQITLNKREVKVTEFLKRCLEGFRLENQESDFSLEEDIHTGSLTAGLDEFQFSVALHNLLSNALKYGGLSPEIVFAARKERNYLLLQVHDNGVGILPDEQKDIFSKFYRGKKVRSKVKGLGLGLYYVRKIIEMHGGTVELESRKGNGTVFIIKVPA